MKGLEPSATSVIGETSCSRKSPVFRETSRFYQLAVRLRFIARTCAVSREMGVTETRRDYLIRLAIAARTKKARARFDGGHY